MPAAEQTKRTGSGTADTPERIVFSGSEETGLTGEAEEFTEEVEGRTGDTTWFADEGAKLAAPPEAGCPAGIGATDRSLELLSPAVALADTNG